MFSPCIYGLDITKNTDPIKNDPTVRLTTLLIISVFFEGLKMTQ